MAKNNFLLLYIVGISLILSAFWMKTILPAILLVVIGFILIIVSALSSVVDFTPKKQKKE